MAMLSRLKRALASKTEVVTFSRLDYWTMLELFDRIPLSDLVRLNRLASWWSGYVRKVCLTKRSITVQCGDRPKTGDHTQDHFNLLKVITIEPHTSNLLGRRMPNITSLELIIDGPKANDFADIIYLIRQWSHQLVNLKLKCHSDNAQARDEPLRVMVYRLMQMKQLFCSLNTIISLRRLSIDCQSWERFSKYSIDLPILCNLKYFYCNTGQYDFKNLRDSLVRYAGPNRNLKQIELPTFVWLEDSLLRERQLLSKLTMLTLGLGHELARDQWTLLPKLTKCTVEGFISSRSKFIQIITDMQCLKLIRNLELTFFISLYFDRDHPGQVLVDLPQLQSVTNLKLSIVAYSTTNLYSSFKSLQIGLKVFPNVQSVHLKYCCNRAVSVHSWIAKAWHNIFFRMLKRHMRRQFFGIECTFEMSK